MTFWMKSDINYIHFVTATQDFTRRWCSQGPVRVGESTKDKAVKTSLARRPPSCAFWPRSFANQYPLVEGDISLYYIHL